MFLFVLFPRVTDLLRMHVSSWNWPNSGKFGRDTRYEGWKSHDSSRIVLDRVLPMATHGQCFNDACFMLVSSFQCRNDPYTKRQEMRTTLPDAGLKGCCLVQGGAAHGWPGCRERGSENPGWCEQWGGWIFSQLLFLDSYQVGSLIVFLSAPKYLETYIIRGEYMIYSKGKWSFVNYSVGVQMPVVLCTC